MCLYVYTYIRERVRCGTFDGFCAWYAHGGEQLVSVRRGGMARVTRATAVILLREIAYKFFGKAVELRFSRVCVVEECGDV